MREYYLFDRGQPQASPLDLIAPGRQHLLKLQENSFQVFLGDADSGIPHHHFHHFAPGCRRQGDPALFRGELDGVSHQIADYLHDSLLVHVHRRQVDDLVDDVQALGLGQRLQPLQSASYQGRQVGFAEVIVQHPRFHFGQVQQRVDQVDQTIALLDDNGEDALLLIVNLSAQTVK